MAVDWWWLEVLPTNFPDQMKTYLPHFLGYKEYAEFQIYSISNFGMLGFSDGHTSYHFY